MAKTRTAQISTTQ
jgi:hypothetical protein